MDKKMFCFQCEQTAGCAGCSTYSAIDSETIFAASGLWFATLGGKYP